VFVYVRDGKILRITPVDFDGKDPEPWTIEARGRSFSPPHKSTISPHAQAWKSMVYSEDRLLYPLKRVDFDPNGAPGSTGPGGRNAQNRGISGYERISWDEALDLVASEITRMKTQYGPGAILNTHPSHHTFGFIGYFISARARFMNLIGHTQAVMNPDSWEGWYWGALHHWGQSMRLGAPETYGTVEDCLKNCEMVVFWSSDPESTGGIYGAFEGTVRRQWLKELGVKFIHVDPYYNHTAALFGGKWFAPKPGTENAMALAIVHTWITEDLYDKAFVSRATVGFEEWKGYVMGAQDARVARARDRHPREGRAGLGARVGQEAHLLGRRRSDRVRQCLPLGHRNRVGQTYGVHDGHAGHRQAGCQHGQHAARHSSGYPLLLPRLLRRWPLWGCKRQRDNREHVPAYAAAAHHKHRGAEGAQAASA
jgi:anaerobic selenocysteine-containing dehydrogenase